MVSRLMTHDEAQAKAALEAGFEVIALAVLERCSAGPQWRGVYEDVNSQVSSARRLPLCSGHTGLCCIRLAP
jgi:hypothetical protein